LVTLSGIGRKLTANLDLNSVLEQVYQSLNKVLDAHIFLLGVTEPEHNRINVPLLVEKKQKLPAIAFDLDDQSKPAVWCIHNRKELIINSQQQWLEHFGKPMPATLKGEKMITVVYQPLIIGEKIVGCISIQSPEPNAYDEQQLGMIRTLSRYVAIAVANAMGFTELEQQKRKTEKKNKELTIAQQQLLATQKMASLGMLASSVAEQISVPTNLALTANHEVSSIISTMQQQLSQTDATTPPTIDQQQQLEKLSKFNQTAEHGSKQIKSLIDSVRSFEHQDDQNLQQITLNQQVESTIKTLKSRYQHIDFQVEANLKQSTLVYSEKLSQALLNLLINACQAIINKQEKIPDSKKGQVILDGKEENHQFILTIQDNGHGMSTAVQQQIVQPFYSTSDNDIGLGLTISLDIITDLGGQLGIESDPTTGTLISINLPLS
jgi:signal transduction histidine kinase